LLAAANEAAGYLSFACFEMNERGHTTKKRKSSQRKFTHLALKKRATQKCSQLFGTRLQLD